MPRLDGQAEMKSILALVSASRSASVNGAVIDTAGYTSSTYSVSAATVTTADVSNTIAFKVQHGSLADGSDMVDVPTADITGSAIINLATQDDQVIGLISHVPQTVQGKRYERIVATVTGTVLAVFGSTCLLTGSRKTPVN